MSKRAAILLSRLDSQRYPNKALSTLGDKTLIEWCIDELVGSQMFEVILATTDRKLDDPLAEIAVKKGILCYRGDELNIAKRVLDCANHFQLESFARVNGDSPFTQRELLETGFALLDEQNCDFVTNLIPRHYPYGISVEILRTKVFEANFNLLETDHDREHLTSFYYDKMNDVNVYKIHNKEFNDHDIRLTIDTPDDSIKLNALIHLLNEKGDFSLKSILSSYNQLK